MLLLQSPETSIMTGRCMPVGNHYEETMTFDILLSVALIVCGLGLLSRMLRWFSGGVSATDRNLSVISRIAAVAWAVPKVLVSLRLLAVFKGLILDGLLQIRLFRTDQNRWLAHQLIMWGFLLLLIFHAMDGIFTTQLTRFYEPTLNPWRALRNLFGLMVVAGLVLAVRRRVMGRSRLKTSSMDIAVLVWVGAVVLTGFLIEGAKIASRSEFYRMVEDYHDIEATEEVEALEAVWVSDYGLAAGKPGLVYTEDQLALGREVNDMSCVDCHARPQWAPASYALSRLLIPLSRNPDRGELVLLAYWLHVLLCLGILAWLPFGKMRHCLTGPLSGIVDRCWRDDPDNATGAVRRMLSLDACLHCGLCADRCSVGFCAERLDNRYILPAEKLTVLGARFNPDSSEATALLEGLTVCTNCRRCTDVCPVGIDLQDLWDTVREDLLARGGLDGFALSPLGIHRAVSFEDAFETSQQQLELKRQQAVASVKDNAIHPVERFGGLIGGITGNGAFRLCYECKTCTSSCPIVGMVSLQELGLAPHQIIQATALGLDDLVASSRMLWTCLGCYRCQDRCPQGVSVTDIIYLHKNNALARMKTIPTRKGD
jgi:heterodisulfide reductase subunit C/nitrate reductase gamma subunit